MLCLKSREYNNHYTAVAESTKLVRQPQYSFNVMCNGYGTSIQAAAVAVPLSNSVNPLSL